MIVKVLYSSRIRKFLATLSFPRLFLIWVAAYFSFGMIFAGMYMWLGGSCSVQASNVCATAFEYIYFSFTSWATVGYGDFVPVKAASRIISILQGFVGVTLNALLLSIIVFKSLKRAAPIIFPSKLVYDVDRHNFWFRFINVDPEQLRDISVNVFLLYYFDGDYKDQYDTLTSTANIGIKHYPSRPSLNLTALRTKSNDGCDRDGSHPGDFNPVTISPLHFGCSGSRHSGWAEVHLEIVGYFESTGDRFFSRKEYNIGDIVCGKFDDVNNNKIINASRKEKSKHLSSKFNITLETDANKCLMCVYLTRCPFSLAQQTRSFHGVAASLS
jgi:hypothetical protein